MDRRLSGALAWGALILIVGIPGLDMLNRSSSETAGAVTAPAVGGKDALSWQSTSADVAKSSFGPQLDAVSSDSENATDAGEDDSLPDVTLLANAPDATASETPPAAPNPSIITLDTGGEVAPPAKLDHLDIDKVIADVTASPAADQPAPDAAEPAATATPDTASSVIAAKVRDVLFSSPDTAVNPEASSAPDASGTSVVATDMGLRSAIDLPSGTANSATTANDDLAAVATAPLDFSTTATSLPETIPYPAPAIRRINQPVAQVKFVPPEPVPEVRPDNAIFFGDWVNTPPKTAATGPGR